MSGGIYIKRSSTMYHMTHRWSYQLEKKNQLVSTKEWPKKHTFFNAMSKTCAITNGTSEMNTKKQKMDRAANVLRRDLLLVKLLKNKNKVLLTWIEICCDQTTRAFYCTSLMLPA